MPDEEIVWIFGWLDQSEWGSGPWGDEPDRVLWTDAATGYPCLARRSYMGAWCGYVGVDQGHPWHGRDFSELQLDVHGMSYSAPCDGDEETGICHVPAEGEDTIWWFGFDCMHFRDLVPRVRAFERELSPELAFPEQHYWTLPEVRQEILHLAQELAAAKA